ncbi:uncharacterized protein LOC143550112 [Bidens hawaiensis]|uniref:uncharacterized protein LOC143550112 n=1 Tax=Bidens hawaiensis TaxID=980011 RepID=UPI00404B748E
MTDKPSTHLFFCFTSSSSMKISSSRSVLSPARTVYSREPPPPITLSTSLSRRLSKSRSIRGGAASPAMFPVTGKKRGSGFDNPEPSSPKVTCIGQVRVKTRKRHVKNVRSLSTRRKLKHSRSQRQRNNSINSINSINNINNNNNGNNHNQRWVHIPMTICEALRTSCLFPCRASNEEKKVGSTRWVVAVQDGEVEMVAGGDDVEEVGSVRRHHVFDDLEIVDDVILGSEVESVGVDVVPPKNALLLMRGRSDPVKVEALANQILEEKCEEEFEEAVDFEEKLMVSKVIEDVEVEDEQVMVLDDINDTEEINMELEMNQSVVEEEKQSIKEGNEEQSMEINEEDVKKQSMEINEKDVKKQSIKINEEDVKKQSMEINEYVKKQSLEMNEEEEEDQEQSMEINKEEDQKQSMEINEEEESYFIGNLFEENADEEQEIEEEESDSDMKDALEVLFEDVEEAETGESNTEQIKQFEEQIETEELILKEIKQFEEGEDEMLTEFTEKTEAGESKLEEIKHFEEGNEEMFTQFTESYDETEESKLEQVKHFEEEIEEMLTEFIARSETEESKTKVKDFVEENEEITEILERENEEREKIESLPECLLMMYEPKLPMEVSKETLVCRNDFIRTHSGRKKPPPVKSINESKVVGQTSDSMIAMLEQKLVSTMGFEPLALTRCKSEPVRRARETCCLQNQLEPPRRASFGVGMAGLAG